MISCSRRAASVAISAGLALLGRALPLCATELPAPTESRAEPPRLTPPVLKRALAVTYPAGETGAARVVLELVVERDGRVQEATAIDGAEPFRSLALETVRDAEFEPAQKGDEPVRARIRLEVRFTPERDRALPPEDVKGRSPDAPRPATPIEIVVLGERKAPALSSLSRLEVRELPGAFGDPFRAVEIMPGVTPIFSGVPFFFVRGAPPGNVGYFLDGVRVPLLYHVALGPSVIHPGLVDRVDVYSGGYPARYGRYAGAIVSAETSAPREELRGEANVRLFDAGALVEAPFAGGRGSALVGGRYSYTAALLSLLAPDVTLAYWDYQARVSYALGPKLRVSAFGFGAYDLFRADSEDSSIGTQFHRVDLRLDYLPDPRTKLRVGVMAGLDRSAARSPAGDEADDTPELQDQLGGVRLELERQLDARLKLRAGADLNLDRYRIVDVSDSGRARELLSTRDDVTTGARGDLVWEPAPGVVITPGLRADLYTSGRRHAVAFEPRVAAEFEVSRKVRIEHSFGIAQQAPSFPVPVPGFAVSDLKDGLQRSLQSSAGVVVRPGAELQVGLTLFHAAFFNLTDVLGTFSLREQISRANEEDVLRDELDFRALGQAYGLELSIKRPLTKRLGGYLAYTLSRSTRSLGQIRQKPAGFDRTHVLHAALALDLGANYRAGARLTTYSGVPAQIETDEDGNRPAAPRSPAYYRVDVRFEKRWPIDRKGRSVAFVLEMLNATLNKETPFVECDSDGCSGDAIGPVSIPSLGAEVFF